MTDPATVWRDQCNGRTLSCVNCGRELGGRHDVLYYAYAIERTKARRVAESGGSTLETIKPPTDNDPSRTLADDVRDALHDRPHP